MTAVTFTLIVLALAPVVAVEESASSHANPVRKVVTMLDNMQKKVVAQGKEQKEAFDKFMCWCATSQKSLDGSIGLAQGAIESGGAAHEAAVERKALTEADLKAHQQARADAEESMAKATEIRNKEAAAFAKEKNDGEANVAAIGKAVAALEKGAGGAFLQTAEAQTLKTFVMVKATIDDLNREDILAFLSGSGSYAPQSGQVTGLLKTMGDEMSEGLADAIAAEKKSIAEYESLTASKKKEVVVLSKQIEVELNRVGDLGVEIAAMGNDIEDAQQSLAADRAFTAGTAKACETKAKEWAEIQDLRTQELAALSETIKVLNDDDALELFKGTLPGASASLLQVEGSTAAVRRQALAIIGSATRAAGSPRPELDLISLALNGKKKGFDAVIKMIDSMTGNLKTEQTEDDDKKAYCEEQFDLSDDKKKATENAMKDAQTALEELKGLLVGVNEELASLASGITALDKAVAEATRDRKLENAEFKELVASNAAAKELLLWAKNRLNKFYAPNLYKPAPKRELNREDQIVVAEGGTLAPTMPSGIADTGITVGGAASFVQVAQQATGAGAPPPPPETFGAYAKQGETNSGVTEMIGLLVGDLDKEMTEAKVVEKNSQADYENMIKEAGTKRAQDSKAITDREAAKASAEESTDAHADALVDAQKEHLAVGKYILELHQSCDWLVKNYAARKNARAGEVESLGRAKDVLKGAGYA